MPKLHINISEQIEQKIDERIKETGQSKSEIARNCLVEGLGL
jgi:metal-responsive CopG/Arc/MetJ family transcriptional regulator